MEKIEPGKIEESKSVKETAGLKLNQTLDKPLTTNEPGWEIYWRKRLLKEDGVPDEVLVVLRRMKEGDTKSGDKIIFKDYVRSRLLGEAYVGIRERLERQVLEDIEKKSPGLPINEKGWIDYWLLRLPKEADVPEEILEIVDKLKVGKNPGKEKFATLQHYISLRAPIKSLVEKSVAKLQKELYDGLKNLLDAVDKANQEMLSIGKLNVLSEQERKDLMMDFRNKTSLEYWAKRLLPEADLLPSDVRQAVLDYNTGLPALKEVASPIIIFYAIKRLSVLKFNIQKRLVMAEFKKRLKNIDKRENYNEEEMKDRRTIFYEEDGEKLFVKVGDKIKYLSFGDIAGDYLWGIKYAPDSNLPDNIWRKIRKISDLAEARAKVGDIFNQELSNIYGVPLGSQNMTEEFLEKRPQAGMIAEKAVVSYLERLQYNYPDLVFRVEPSNALEDTRLKYDFKIFVPQKTRGVALEGDKMPRDNYVKEKVKLGIQFTISNSSELQNHKKKQLEEARKQITDENLKRFVKRKVDDIVLVTIPLNNFGLYFWKWVKEGKPPGGPERYLTVSERKKILKDIFQNFADVDLGALTGE